MFGIVFIRTALNVETCMMKGALTCLSCWLPWKTQPQWIQVRPTSHSLTSRGSATPVDPSRCTQPTSTTLTVHMPKLRPEQQTEVSELTAAATVGTQDAATSSQRIHVPTVDKQSQETSRVRRYLENNRHFNPQVSVVLPQARCLLSGKALPSLGTRSGIQTKCLNPQGSDVLPQGTHILCGTTLPSLRTRAEFWSTPSLLESDHPQKTSLEFWRGLETALRGSSESQYSRRLPVHV